MWFSFQYLPRVKRGWTLWIMVKSEEGVSRLLTFFWTESAQAIFISFWTESTQIISFWAVSTQMIFISFWTESTKMIFISFCTESDAGLDPVDHGETNKLHYYTKTKRT